jgi:hypothetical protein
MKLRTGFPPEAAPWPEHREPVIKIGARHGWRELGLAELWSRRELISSSSRGSQGQVPANRFRGRCGRTCSRFC